MLRVAAAQYPIERLPTLAAYRDKIARWVAAAADGGARLLVFPEYGAMEYVGALGDAVVGNLAASLGAVADLLPDFDALHADLARRHRVHILAASGPSRRPGGRFVNAARLFAPNGKSGTQEKLIMTPFEIGWGISPGEGLTVFETEIGRLGVAICYDSEFPLLVRALTEAGARLILIPSCTEFLSGFNRVRTAALARALENTCATVLSPTIGEAAWSPSVDRSAGAAGIYVPADHGFSETGVLAEGPADRPQWVFADIDLERLARVRAAGEMRNDSDWAAQPGATPLARNAAVMSLI